jgi:hypothetical protein
MLNLTLPSARSRLSAGLINGGARADPSDGPPGGEQPLASTAAAHYWTPCLAWHVHRQHRKARGISVERHCKVAMNREECSGLIVNTTRVYADGVRNRNCSYGATSYPLPA